MPNTRAFSAITTWHSQSAILWISWTWGLSYVIPPRYRIPFAEVFPDALNATHLPMWVWGVLLLIGASMSLVAERIIRSTRLRPWGLALGGHMLLAGVYLTLAVGALVESLSQVQGSVTSWMFWGNVVSAISRTVLWGVVGYLHVTYARLPRPVELSREIS